MAVVGEVEHDVLQDRNAFENVGQLAKVVVLGHGEKPRTCLLAIEAREYGNPAPVGFELIRKNESCFPDAVEGGACPNSESQNQHAESRHAPFSEQRAYAVADVLLEVIPPKPAASFVKALFGVHDVPEGTPCGCSRLFFAHPPLPQAHYLELYVCLDLGSEVVEFAFASQRGFNL